jgi:hypothetical protein
MTNRHERRNEHDVERNRWLRSYKLRFARCLTCYSTLAYLLSFERHGITTKEARAMLALRPYDRLGAVKDRTKDIEAHRLVDDLLDRYAVFLKTVDQDKESLLREFDPERKGARLREGDEFGQTMAKLMLLLGRNSPKLFRYMIV